MKADTLRQARALHEKIDELDKVKRVNIMLFDLKFLSGAGHGWLMVPKELLRELAISKSMFTEFSLEDLLSTGYLYLEEDVDFDRFIQLIHNVLKLDYSIDRVEFGGHLRDYTGDGYVKYLKSDSLASSVWSHQQSLKWEARRESMNV
ncbi:hypothetical protein [Acinetobacter sp.]|uniref:hypothetical protein n=1 Tax=Acinetobacter sp. TaxID=472 RepID=UPI000C091215|nr:hypothetical protein [Acinetobacter sp.]MAK30124.1 hypothetical protein [Acinetobacter sp.]|tara:strand:+ start:754 stop:1197 length:444 start_codon:yes stop_codon:yes gene_type:complete